MLAFVAGAALLRKPTAGRQTPALEIVAPLSLTGAGATTGNLILDGARLAVEEANKASDAPRIDLTVLDDASDIGRGQELARRIAARDTVAVFGPATSPMSFAVGPIYAEAGLVSLGAITTADGVTANATAFRASFSTSDIGETLANYLRHVLDRSRAVVLIKEDGYGRPAAEGFRRAAERLAITATYHAFTTVAESEQAARRATAEPGQPAIVLAMLDADAAPVLLTLRRQGAQGIVLGTNTIAGEFFNSRFAGEPEERQRPGFFTDGIYAASPVILDSGNAETLAFADRFRTRFGHDPSYLEAQGYETGRLTVAAVRAAQTGSGAGVRARRTAARDYLVSLNGPANAIAGLNGPLWFTLERGRQQALRLGRFQGGRFESAPGQLMPVSHPDPAEIASGAVIDIGSSRFVRRQQVVYTGIFLNEIPRVDLPQSTFTADFYLWMRFARSGVTAAADPTEIEFPNLVRGSFDGKRPVAQRDLGDGMTYRLWRMRGDFKNDYDLHRYPADRQTLAIRFFNSRAASDRLVYVIDRRSFDARAGGAAVDTGEGDSVVGIARAGGALQTPADIKAALAFGGAAAPAAFRDLTQWEALRVDQRRDNMVTKSALGDPELVGLERVRELSGFNLSIDLSRRILATLVKTLLPLGLMSLIMFASLYFPNALVKEKVTVAITAALSGAVLLSAINSQLGNVGYVIAVEYGSYVFFMLCLLCIVTVLAAERFRVAGHQPTAIAVELWSRRVFLATVAATAAVGLLAYSR